jgi:hypothetical protein
MDTPGADFDVNCKVEGWWKRLTECPRDFKAPNTVGKLGAALAASLGSLGLQVLVFLLIRKVLPRIYSPKVHLVR